MLLVHPVTLDPETLVMQVPKKKFHWTSKPYINFFPGSGSRLITSSLLYRGGSKSFMLRMTTSTSTAEAVVGSDRMFSATAGVIHSRPGKR